MQHPLWARLGFVVFGIHTDVQQWVLRRHHCVSCQQHKQCLPHSHPHSQPSRIREPGGDGAVQKGNSTGGVLSQAAVNKVLWGPGTPENTPADHQQLTALRTKAQSPQARL